MQIQLTHDAHWDRDRGTFAVGEAFLNGNLLSAPDITSYFLDTTDKSTFREKLQQLNGFFAVIHETDNKLFLAVDHLRSYPLFYSITDEIRISDSAEWIHQKESEQSCDPIAATEYLFTTYVTGPDTLSPGVSQLQAGEIVEIDRSKEAPSVSRDRYFRHIPDHSPEPTDIDQVDTVMKDVYQRLVSYADGRPIVLSLSGGYDSRLNALMLSRLGYDNLLAYTHDSASGDPGDVKVAKSIASQLGIEHVVTEVEHADFRKLYESEEWGQYLSSVGYLSQIPNISGVVTAQKLRETDQVPDDAVFVHGHHPVGGSLLPASMRSKQTVDKNQFIDMMWRRNYHRWAPSTAMQETTIKKLEQRMLDHLPTAIYEQTEVEDVSKAVAAFESWFWQERLAKYTINRHNELYLNRDVWLPLCDKAYFNFLSEIPYQDRIGKRIQKQYVDWLESQVGLDLSNSTGTTAVSLKKNAWNTIRKAVVSLPDPVEAQIRSAYDAYQSNQRKQYEYDPRYGIIPEKEFNLIDMQKHHHKSLLFLILYRDGYFTIDDESTELDRALQTKSQRG